MTGAVAALVTGSGEARRTVRYAARLARAWERPLLLMVPLPATGSPVPPVAELHVARRRMQAAEDLVGPLLADPGLAGVPVHVRVASYRPQGSRTPVLSAALAAARRSGAAVLVAGPRAAGTGAGRGVLLFDPDSGRVADGQSPELRVGAAE